MMTKYTDLNADMQLAQSATLLVKEAVANGSSLAVAVRDVVKRTHPLYRLAPWTVWDDATGSFVCAATVADHIELAVKSK